MTALADTTVLRFAPALTCCYKDQSAILRAGGRTFRYEGKATTLLRRLLPLLDGRRDLSGVMAEVGDDRLRPIVFRLCARLVADGMLVDPTAGVPDGYPGGLLGGWGPDGTSGLCPITTMRVVGTPGEVEAVARVAPAHWEIRPASLTEIVGVATPEGVCTTVWVTNPHDELLAQWNETAYHNGQPWLPISHYDGEVAVVGPYVHPRTTPCFECYRRRRAARHPLGADYLALRPLDDTPLTSAGLTAVLAGLGVAMLQEWETRADPHIPGGVRTVTFERGPVISSELVLRVPRCTACRPGAAAARPTLWSEYFASDEAVSFTEETATEETAAWPR